MIQINEMEQKNVVTNPSIPAIHTSNDPVIMNQVSIVLGMVFGGETFPIKWYIYNVIDEGMNFQAMGVSTQIHRSQIIRCF